MLCIFKNNSSKGHCSISQLNGEKGAGRIYWSFESVVEQMSEKGWGRLINFCNDSTQASTCKGNTFPFLQYISSKNFPVLEETFVF